MKRLACALDEATRRLQRAGLETPRLDARLLLEWSAGLSTARLISDPDRVLDDEAVRRFDEAIEARSAGRPVARIVGEKEFWGRAFRLNEHTLVPRPETETVVEAVLARVAPAEKDWCGTVCDLGTGSGAILISLLCEMPKASGTGVDISRRTIDCARRNAEHHGVGERIAWIAGDYGAVPDTRSEIIVCNPPYIAEGDFAGLSREVREFDPRRALYGGSDGLDAYRVLAGRLPEIMTGDGLAALELGAGQLDAVVSLMNMGGLKVESPIADLAGIPRVLVCRLP